MGKHLIQLDFPEQQNKRTKVHNEREKDATSAFQSVNGGGKGSPSDRPYGRPVSETFMKQHHALSNWTNIVKTSKKTWCLGGKLSQQPCTRSQTFR